jgi:hypothetical protein
MNNRAVNPKPRFFNLATSWGTITRVQAGVIDEEAEHAFRSGQCLALAVCYMLSLDDTEQKGHRIKFLLEKYDPNKEPGLYHAYVSDTEGNAIDIIGIQNEESYVNAMKTRYHSTNEFIILEVDLDDAINYMTSKISPLTQGMFNL